MALETTSPIAERARSISEMFEIIVKYLSVYIKPHSVYELPKLIYKCKRNDRRLPPTKMAQLREMSKLKTQRITEETDDKISCMIHTKSSHA